MKRKIAGGLLAVYAASTLLFSVFLSEGTSQNLTGADHSLSPSEFGVLCISTVYPGAVSDVSDSRDNEEAGADQASSGSEADEANQGKQTAGTTVREEEKPEPVVFGEDPAVLILHTHATETYLPADEGNYHSKKKENSVRDVGEVLAKSLEEEGISVVHDQTLHDSPSYSSSYSRSAETVKSLLHQYPTIRCVIDLHRDATDSEAPGATLSVGGKSCARYMYVVSTAVPNYKTNAKFISAMNDTAAENFSGFTGTVLERGYPYNQSLADRYLLVEFGNNRNDIADVRNTARIYGKILAQTLKAGY